MARLVRQIMANRSTVWHRFAVLEAALLLGKVITGWDERELPGIRKFQHGATRGLVCFEPAIQKKLSRLLSRR